ncbi:MAG TPA: GGDEF domain-containing protein [Noviherbaspirillum sp.]|jgi:diguanylate cyclase (GGDEF)-like protein|uniref:GGDEF domain-containing protein n=1 Tax=Noviherbaspirillum sp. TaxID=1926288 RepID=UPI002F931701
MSSTFVILLVGAVFCVLMLLVLISLLRSSIAGIREWCVANAFACAALVLYAFGRELPPLVAYEVANGVYAAAAVALFAGFRRFFGLRVSLPILAGAVLSLAAAIAFFHYRVDSFVARTIVVALFQGSFCVGIALTIRRSRKAWRSRYPYYFTQTMALVVALGHFIRSAIYLGHAADMTSLLQPSPWNLVFLSLGSFVLPVLTFGAVMMVHDTMMEKAEHAANRDFLTGAWSRRAFFEIAEREMSRSQRTGRHLSLLLLDVDNFKQINDSYGHAAGDQVLIEVVLRAETITRSIDYFSRVGGEEFAVLLPETSRTAALVVAERLRSVLERKAGLGVAAYTVSIGVATLHGTESYHDVIKRADAALYAAKATGRNRVVCEPD